MLSPTRGVGSPPLPRREVIDLVESDEDAWPGATAYDDLTATRLSRATLDTDANGRRSSVSPAHPFHNVIDLSILDDDDLMVYLADHPLDRNSPSPLDPELHMTTEDPPLSYEVFSTQVLEVFPDVSHDYLKLQWSERVPLAGSLDPPIFKQDQIAQTVILQLIDNTDYPREKHRSITCKRKRSTDTDSSEDELLDWKVKRVKLRDDIDYVREMTITLLNEFLLVPSDHIKRVCRAQIFLYESFLNLAQGDKQDNNNNKPSFQSLKQARKNKLSPHIPPKEVAEVLHAEFTAARKHHSKREAHRKKVQEDQDAAVAEHVLAEETGATCECQCCFTDTPILRAVHCNGTETHFFCIDCALNYAKAQTEKGQYQLICFATTECKADFSRSDKLRFLDAEMLKLLDRLEQNDIMRIAEIEGLAKCPFCDYAEIYPDVSENKVFHCKASTCMKASCRLCNLDSHIPKTCAEAKAENGISERHILEEAMTEALVRKCPKCQTPILKEDGCNKMICTKCRCAICDYCGKDITKEGYSHFSGRPNACPTNDDTFRRNDARVKAAEKEAMDKIRAENPELSEEDLKIKFSEKVQSGPDRRTRRDLHPDAFDHYAAPDGWGFLRGEALAMIEPARRYLDDPAHNPVDPVLMRAEMQPQMPQMPPRPPDNPYVPPYLQAMRARLARRHRGYRELDGTLANPERNPFLADYRPDIVLGMPQLRAQEPEAPEDDPILAARRAYLAHREEQNERFRRMQEISEEQRRERQRQLEQIQRGTQRLRERTEEILARRREDRAAGHDMLASRITRLNRRLSAHQYRPAGELERVMREPWDPADERVPVQRPTDHVLGGAGAGARDAQRAAADLDELVTASDDRMRRALDVIRDRRRALEIDDDRTRRAAQAQARYRPAGLEDPLQTVGEVPAAQPSATLGQLPDPPSPAARRRFRVPRFGTAEVDVAGPEVGRLARRVSQRVRLDWEDETLGEEL